jgi:Spy/CpxP family protein refolding chaperone
MKTQFVKFLATGALAAGMAFAQTGPATPAPGVQSGRSQEARRNFAKEHLARISQELNLTDTQKTQAKEIFNRARETAKPVREQLKENRQALEAAVKADNKGQIEQLSTARGNLMGKMMAIHSEAAAKFYQTLSPEQRVKADQLHAQARERMHNRFRQHSNG